MREQKNDVIINIGSIAGEDSASKSGAMNGPTKSLALYGSKYGVLCVCVSPYPVLTRPGVTHMKTALGRTAEPIELVNPMLHVAFEEGSFLDGINILVDGGRNIMRNKE